MGVSMVGIPASGWLLAGLDDGIKVIDWKQVDDRLTATWTCAKPVHLDGAVIWDGKGDGKGIRRICQLPTGRTFVEAGSSITLTWIVEVGYA